ncbi:unnamed protein product [Leptidea sinapis]|uniref:Uncharacterized protein n=1 Tax=Leptidea sinapis TaxID=189913 RepID=A0A5E4QT59_9NEOP|nr:unnamed protein product [Leptidea sinapis]
MLRSMADIAATFNSGTGYFITFPESRSFTSGWWVVLLTATLAVSVTGDAGVGLFNAKLKQIVTSSTLKWDQYTCAELDMKATCCWDNSDLHIHHAPYQELRVMTYLK